MGGVVSNMAKLSMKSVTEEINDKHLKPWSELCKARFYSYGTPGVQHPFNNGALFLSNCRRSASTTPPSLRTWTKNCCITTLCLLMAARSKGRVSVMNTLPSLKSCCANKWPTLWSKASSQVQFWSKPIVVAGMVVVFLALAYLIYWLPKEKRLFSWRSATSASLLSSVMRSALLSSVMRSAFVSHHDNGKDCCFLGGQLFMLFGSNSYMQFDSGSLQQTGLHTEHRAQDV